MRILFVKLTSMGDLIHALPALTEAMHNVPDVVFDWVADKNFAEIASWHPAVKNVFHTEHRKWRRQPIQSFKTEEISRFLSALRTQQYDLIIDGQGNLKSAVVTRLARGTRCGFDKHSTREQLVHLIYNKKYSVLKEMHAINRLRLLFSQALNYVIDLNNKPDYQIKNYSFTPPPINLPREYVVFVHNASWNSKLYPLAHWHTLICLAKAEGLEVLLPWGNQMEKQQAEQLAKQHTNAKVLPFCSLSELSSILKLSQGAICGDTGLSHLAAALDVACVTMYGPTNVNLIGTLGNNQVHHVPSFPCITCYKHNCHFQNQKFENAQCLASINPELLWQQLRLIK